MHFEYRRNHRIPALAWLLRVNRDGCALVEHGDWVETRERFFCEGAWSDSPFARGAFADASVFVGSGASLDDDGNLVLVTATNTIERLQVLRLGDEVLASNSLAFLLARSGDALDQGYKHYEWDFCSIIEGIDRYTRSVPTRGGRSVRLYYHCNVAIDRALRLIEKPKRRAAPFHSFAGYRDHLFSRVCELCDNAQAPERKHRFAPITTISTGYDSTAAAVLARDNGCRDALTFAAPRPEFGDCDDGTLVAERLGLTVQKLDRLSYQKRDDCPEVEFLASGFGGDDVIFSAFEPMLAGRLLFTGFHGDKVWERTNTKVSPNIVRGDPSGGSMQEFRLRVGFLHLPVPFIGCTAHESIYAISNSSEMKPWRMNDPTYDRPVPRRIVEETGIPRDWFGHSKRAAAVNLPPKADEDDMRKVMSPHTIEAYQRYAGAIPIYRDAREKARWSAMHLLYKASLRIVWRMRRWLAMDVPSDAFVSAKYSRMPNRNYFTFHWALSEMRARYAPAESVVGGTDRSAERHHAVAGARLDVDRVQ